MRDEGKERDELGIKSKRERKGGTMNKYKECE